MNSRKITLRRVFLGLVSCLLCGASSTSEKCDEVRKMCGAYPPRIASYDHQLAVCQGGEWRVFRSNSATSPHTLRAPLSEVAFSWAVPPSNDYEIVYASTSYKQDQTLTVSRSGRDAILPVLPPHREVRERLRGTQAQARERFQEFHGMDERPSGRDPTSKNLALWHDTEFFGRLKSYDLVGFALDQEKSNRPVFGGERLMRVAKNRPKTSWIPFCSWVRPGSPLRIMLAYSDAMSETWPFHFDVDPVLAAGSEQ